MSEPKLTVGRVETWRPFERFVRNIDDKMNSEALWQASVTWRDLHGLIAGLREGDAPPAPQPEAKAEPDYSCPKCGSMDAGDCICSRRAAAAAANARIAELVRERDEARAEDRPWGMGYSAGRMAGYREGAAAAKEACAKRLREEAGRHLGVECLPYDIASHIVRMTEVPDA